MAITAKQVNELRKTTGAGMMDCKNALTESNGDFEKAIDFLRKKGQKIAAKRANKEAKEGKVWLSIDQRDTIGIGFALNCETESVAVNETFLNLGQLILETAKKYNPNTKEELLKLSHSDETIQEHITNLIGKIGEKIDISEYVYCKGHKIVSYLHGDKIGVLVNLKGDIDHSEGIGKDIAMQIAAMTPLSIDESGIPIDLINKEKEIALEKAKSLNKPEKIVERIVESAVKKFISDNTLLEQVFIKDSKIKVKDYINKTAKGLEIQSFNRLSIV